MRYIILHNYGAASDEKFPWVVAGVLSLSPHSPRGSLRFAGTPASCCEGFTNHITWCVIILHITNSHSVQRFCSIQSCSNAHSRTSVVTITSDIIRLLISVLDGSDIQAFGRLTATWKDISSWLVHDTSCSFRYILVRLLVCILFLRILFLHWSRFGRKILNPPNGISRCKRRRRFRDFVCLFSAMKVDVVHSQRRQSGHWKKYQKDTDENYAHGWVPI